MYWRDMDFAEMVCWSILVFLFIFLFVMIGFSVYEAFRAPRLLEGVIYKKEYTPAHTTRGFITISTGKTVMLVPTTNRHPNKWVLYVRENDVEETFYVNKQIFESVETGQRYRFDKRSASIVEPTVIRERKSKEEVMLENKNG